MSKSDRSKPQTALICGASGGLGEVLARTLLSRGMTVCGTMRNPSNHPQGDFRMLAMDVRDAVSVNACFQSARDAMGSIDVVVNCVNEMILGSVEELSVEEIGGVYDINVVGTARIAKAALPIMREQGGGLVVSMSSLGGILAVPYLSAYTSAKFAIEAFSEALYHEVKADNIDIVIMQPVAMRMDRADVGDHLKVAAGVGKDSLTHHVVSVMAKDTRESKLTPQRVSEAIYDVIKSKNRKLRYPMDRAKVVSKIKRLAPQSVIDKMIGGLISKPA